MASRDMNETITAKEKVGKLLNDITSMNDFLSSRVEDVGSVVQQVSQSVGNAVRCLQFEDISSQAIGAAEKHIEHSIEVNKKLTLTLNNDTTDQDIQQVLHHMQSIIHELTEQWKEEGEKAVLQESMNEGEVEQITGFPSGNQ